MKVVVAAAAAARNLPQTDRNQGLEQKQRIASLLDYVIFQLGSLPVGLRLLTRPVRGEVCKLCTKSVKGCDPWISV